MSKKVVRPSTATQRSWLVTGIVGLAAVAYVVLVFLPGQKSIQTLRAQVADRQQQIVQAESLLGHVEQAALRLARTREVSAQWKAAAPSHGKLTEQLALVSLAASEAGLEVERLDPQPPLELKLLAQHGVILQFQGEFGELFDFLHRVEQLPGTIWVTGLRIADDGQPGKSLRGELTLTIFMDRADYAD
ncbi:MAG: type 4a pilus biogenesis protein PilO [Pirellulaceae bacterium]|nr:type 4a pilus biogenesis protein PilO [Pirellulaceae bacterium]